MLIFPFASFPTFRTRPFPPCLAHPFTPMLLAFAAFFNRPIIVQELGSYLLFIYKYINIKETLSFPLLPHPVSPTTPHAAILISALKAVCCRGLILGPGIRWLLDSVPSWFAVAFLPAVSLPCASISLVPRGRWVKGTILLRVLAARLPWRLHRAGGVPSVASEIPFSLSVLPSLGNSSKYLHFIEALGLNK